MRDDTARNPASGPNPASVRLPSRPTRLVGRELEVADLQALLLRTDIRLVTVTGPPGVGKTRLAIEVAALSGDHFNDGVVFIDLSGTHDPHLVPFAMVQQMGVRGIADGATAGGPPIEQRLIAFLIDKEMLVVLDNFEQVVPAAHLVGDLLSACSALKILATSREPLHLLWEQEFPLMPLAVAAAGTGAAAPAVALFAERARAHRPDFALGHDTLPVVAQICARVDGLPLAIELAAAHLRHLSPAALLGNLDRPLELLTAGARDLPERHRTLRAALAWSYNLLSPAEQSLFRRLSVFDGGFTVDAAAAVCAGVVPDLLQGISALADKHLVRESGTPLPDARFDVLDSLREFGLERLEDSQEAKAVRGHHLVYFAQMTDAAARGLRGHEQLGWLARLDLEQDNIRAALGWALQQEDAQTALRMATALDVYWDLRGRFQEGLDWLARGLAVGRDIPPDLRARALASMGFLMVDSGGRLDEARALFEESLALAKQAADDARIADALRGAGLAAMYTWGQVREHPQRDPIAPLWQESLRIYRELGDKVYTAQVMAGWGWRLAIQGNLEEAEDLLGEALTMGEGLGDRQVIALALCGHAHLAARRGDFTSSERLQERVLALGRELGNASLIILSLQILGLWAKAQGNHAAARTRLSEALAAARQAGARLRFPSVVQDLGEVEEFQGRYHHAAALYRDYLALVEERGALFGALPFEMAAGIAAGLGHADVAARLLGAAEGPRETITRHGVPRTGHALQQRRLRLARTALGDEQMAAAQAAGRVLPVEQARAEARKILDDAAAIPPDSPWTDRGPLSRRETEIAVLVAQGLSNRDIARRLFISNRTAETHVQHILNKLGFNARTQIAAWAAQQGPGNT